MRESDQSVASTHLHLETSRLARFFQLLAERIADELDRLIFVLEPYLLLRGMDIDVDLVRTDLERDIDERMCSLCQKTCIKGLKGSLERRGIDKTVCWPINQCEERAESFGHARLMKNKKVPFFEP